MSLTYRSLEEALQRWNASEPVAPHRPEPVQLSVAAWARAEAEAREKEEEVHRAWLDFFRRGGPSPSGEMERHAALLRAIARVRLEEARAVAGSSARVQH